MIAPHTAYEIADYFLLKAEKDGERISNLKLQKLIYYAQGLHLALDKGPLFKEQIKAWNYGPVIPVLYTFYRDNGAAGIPPDNSFNPKSIDKDTRQFLDEIYDAFGQFSATRLMEISHTDQCWKDAHPNGVIHHQAMRNDLKKYLKNE